MHNKMATDLLCVPSLFYAQQLPGAKYQLFKSLPQDLVETGDDNLHIYFDHHSGSDSLDSFSLWYLSLLSSLSFLCSVALCFAWFS